MQIAPEGYVRGWCAGQLEFSTFLGGASEVLIRTHGDRHGPRDLTTGAHNEMAGGDVALQTGAVSISVHQHIDRDAAESSGQAAGNSVDVISQETERGRCPGISKEVVAVVEK
jgi:hypothetical protein